MSQQTVPIFDYPSNPSPLSVTTRRHGTTLVVAVSGELDLATARVVSDAMAVHDGRYTKIVYELSSLDFVDCTGLSSLVDVKTPLQQISVRDPSESARRLLGLVGMESIIED